MALQIVTFWNRIEFSGRMDGEIGDLSKKMERELRRVGSLNVGVSQGLEGRVGTGGSGDAFEREGGVEVEEEGREG